MKKENKRYYVCGTAIVILVMTIFGFVMFYKHISSLKKELSGINKELILLDQRAKNKLATITLLDSTKESRQELYKKFVPIKDPTLFLDMLDVVAKEVGVESYSEQVQIVPNDKILPNVKEGLQQKINVHLSVEGKWEEVFNFISLLEVFPYIITIDTITITLSESDDTWKGQIKLHSNTM